MQASSSRHRLKRIHPFSCAAFLSQYTSYLYDYVLVAKTIENQEREAFKKQIEYIEELKKKNIKVTVGANKGSAMTFVFFSKGPDCSSLILVSSPSENHRR